MADDPLKYFRIEARELLEQMGQGVLALEKGVRPDTVSLLLRLAHTLKGAARVVKQREIAELSHQLEDLLLPLRDGGVPPTANRLLQLIDGMVKLVPSAPGAARAAVAAAVDPASAPLELSRDSRPETNELQQVLDGLAEVSVRHASLDESVRDLADVQQLLADLGAPLLARQRLEAVTRHLSDGLSVADRELKQVRSDAEQLQLSPASVMFSAIERGARDQAQVLGRTVSFQSVGGEVRLDARVLQQVQGAMLQAMRNAIAHGIEAPSERTLAGKKPVGQLTLEVVRRGDRVSFICRDDGRGVDVEAVRRAFQRRAPADTSIPGLDEKAILARLLEGGVSTATRVSQAAGRGVGLNVITDVAQRLHGEAVMRTEAGKGTVVELTVPLTMAALDALMVSVAGDTVALPLQQVRRNLRLESSQLMRGADRDAVLVDGAMVPFVWLDALLKTRTRRDGERPPQCTAVVLGTARGTVALGVDSLVGTRSVVLRSLPAMAKADPLLAGATFDVEGHPYWVLDAEQVVQQAGALRTAAPAKKSDKVPVLVIDDSLTTRMLEQSILESAGYDVTTATSAEEGLERAKQRRFALFLVDVEMPGIDGFTFVSRIRADPKLQHTPAILVTSRNAPEDKRRAVEVGATDYVVKSEFDQVALLERIKGLVS